MQPLVPIICSHLCPVYAAICACQMQPLVPIICSHLCPSNAATCARHMQPLCPSNTATLPSNAAPVPSICRPCAQHMPPLCPSNTVTVPIMCSHCVHQMQPLVPIKCIHLCLLYVATCAHHMQPLVPSICSHCAHRPPPLAGLAGSSSSPRQCTRAAVTSAPACVSSALLPKHHASNRVAWRFGQPGN
ncbi:hypothetical protein AB205_0142130, partial [Aquarana catesbeiana]